LAVSLWKVFAPAAGGRVGDESPTTANQALLAAAGEDGTW